MPETCGVFFDKIKFGKFARLVGFIKKKEDCPLMGRSQIVKRGIFRSLLEEMTEDWGNLLKIFSP
jgi:hypothetical protein